MATQSRVLSINCLNQVVLYEVFAILRDHCTIKHASASASDLRTKSLYYHMNTWNPESNWDWIKISRVCRYWRNTALDFPSLWSHFLSFKNKERTTAFLERSKRAKLVVFARTSNGDSKENEKKLECLLMALEHAERVRYLKLDVSLEPYQRDLWKSVQIRLALPMPNLSLAFFSLGTSEDLLLPLHLSEATSNVTCLELTNLTYTGNLALPVGLLELKLTSVVGLDAVPFLSSLRSCPNLVILVLNKVHWKVDWNMVFGEVHRSDDVAISLPRLFNFCFLFDEEDREQSNMIAKSIEIPEDATWLYSFTAHYWGSVHEDAFFLRFAKSPDCENLEIEIKPRKILIRSSRPIANGDLRTERTTYSSEILLNWKSSGSLDSIIERVVDLLELCKWKTAKSVKLNLYLTSWYLEGEEWIPFLSALPSVQDVEVMFEEKNTHFMQQNRKKSAEGFLKVLIHVDSLFIPPHPVLCRNLEHLNIKFGDRTLAPENLSSILREGLSNRKEMGLKLKSLSVSSHYVVEGMHKDFSDLVDKFSYN